MKLTFLGAAQTVTGSRYLVEEEGQKILIDCGLFQGRKELRRRNWDPFPIPPEEIDCVILTHAHIDHSGYLPLLVKNGFTGPIYSSKATAALCRILLIDSGRIQEEDARRANRYGYTKHKPALALYTEADAMRCLKQFQVVELGRYHPLGEESQFILKRAGHILGATFVTIRNFNSRLVFSGDVGRPDDLVINAPATIQSADCLVLESTYGERLHSTRDPLDQVSEIINRTYEQNGTVIVPSFAVGRAQTLLYIMFRLKQEGRIPDLPVYLDSPMAINATSVLSKHSQEHRLSRDTCKRVCSSAQYIHTAEESAALHTKPQTPSIIISASGMATGGRILHHLRFFGPDERNTILFTGYQADGTRGDRILRGEKVVKMLGEEVPIRAKVDCLENMSAHADYRELIGWLKGFRDPPRKVFLTHGNLASANALKEKIEETFGWKVSVPEHLQSEEI